MDDLVAIIEAAQNYLAPDDIEVIIYHHPCPDGSAGAFAAWYRLADKKILYMPYARENLNSGIAPYNTEAVACKNVLFIDCAPSLQGYNEICATAKKVMVLDHHSSAAAELLDQAGCFFTMKNSGAVLAWHYFFGLQVKLPLMFSLIQDRDLLLWEQKLQSFALDKAIATLNPNFDFKFFKPYLNDMQLQELINQGQEIIDSNNLEIEKYVNSAETKRYICQTTKKTYNIKCVQLPDYSATLQVSEILRLEDNVDFCMTWYLESDDIYRISMRTSKSQEDVDLSVISKNFAPEAFISGGGHPYKAGCRVHGYPGNYLQQAVEERIAVGTPRLVMH